MKLRKEWLDEPFRSKNGDGLNGMWTVKSIKHFGIGFTIGHCHIEWTERTGEKFWQVTARLANDESLPLNEFKRLSDAVELANDNTEVARLIAFEKGEQNNEIIVIVKVKLADGHDTIARQIVNNLAMAIEAGSVFDYVNLNINNVHISTPDGLNAIEV